MTNKSPGLYRIFFRHSSETSFLAILNEEASILQIGVGFSELWSLFHLRSSQLGLEIMIKVYRHFVCWSVVMKQL
jgi:hypothetical protein